MTLYRVGNEVKLGRIEFNEGEIRGSTVAALSDGGWVVVWADYSNDLESYVIYQQHYDSSGQRLLPVGTKVKATQAEGDQLLLDPQPVVTALADGGWVVTWSAVPTVDSQIKYIYQQRFIPNLAPTSIVLNGLPAPEASASGTPVGTLTGGDANLPYGDQLTYELIDDAGGRFSLQGDRIVVADGLKLDFEQARSHSIVVRATDRDGKSVTQTVAVPVGDVARENVTGSNGPDRFVGGADVDQFRGMGGDDVLTGGLGNDVLTGGAGKDVFVFDQKPNKKTNMDVITDYLVKDDSIHLENSIFKKLGKKGSPEAPAKLSKSFFALDKATDANDYLVYVRKTGALFYDEDGSGSKAAVQIAKLPKKLAKFSAAEFFVI